jgi:hypothetical protein
MSILTREQAFGQPGNPASEIYYWPEDSEVVASAERFNAINFGLYDAILQVESEAAAVLATHTASLIEHTTSLTGHSTALADRYTKAEADATASTLITAIQNVQAALDNLNTLYQTDTEAAAALAALSLQWDETSADFQATVTGWMNARYTKQETNTLLDAKADVGDSYTKAESEQLLSQKAAATHNHTLRIGNGSAELIQMGSQEMLNIKAGYGITLAFDNNLNQVELETNLAAEIAAAETGAITALRDGVTADGNTLAKLRGLIAAIETALGVDDVSLDTLQEVISAIRTDQGLIDSLTSSKVNVNDIVDGLTSTETTKPLSANQGRSLKLMLDNVLAQTWIIATSPKRITQDMLLLAEQNGLSIGPIAVAQNINVTVQPNSTWRII